LKTAQNAKKPTISLPSRNLYTKNFSGKEKQMGKKQPSEMDLQPVKTKPKFHTLSTMENKFHGVKFSLKSQYWLGYS
jgi:hypothetical protein